MKENVKKRTNLPVLIPNTPNFKNYKKFDYNVYRNKNALNLFRF